MKMNFIVFLCGVFFMANFNSVNSQRQRTARLKPMNVNRNHLTLSGFSSGGSFAQQVQFSFSSLFGGIAVFSDTYYRCGTPTGKIEDYEGSCTIMNSNSLRSRTRRDHNVSNVMTEIERNFRSGLIENPQNLRDTRLFVFAGTRSSKFSADQSLRIVNVYEPYINNVNNIMTEVRAAELVLPSDSYGGNCGSDASNNYYIANCNYSGAYESLNFLLLNMLRRPARNVAVHSLETFDQTEFFKGNEDKTFMDRTGYLYMPSGCRDAESNITCLLHFYFHGCSTGREFNGTNHIMNSGFLQVAESNNIIMVFPQAMSSDENDEGCWDTFGLTGNQFATQRGPQIAAIRNMLQRIIPSLDRQRVGVPSGLYGSPQQGYPASIGIRNDSNTQTTSRPNPQSTESPPTSIHLIVPNGRLTVQHGPGQLSGAEALQLLDSQMRTPETTTARPTFQQQPQQQSSNSNAVQPARPANFQDQGPTAFPVIDITNSPSDFVQPPSDTDNFDNFQTFNTQPQQQNFVNQQPQQFQPQQFQQPQIQQFQQQPQPQRQQFNPQFQGNFNRFNPDQSFDSSINSNTFPQSRPNQQNNFSELRNAFNTQMPNAFPRQFTRQQRHIQFHPPSRSFNPIKAVTTMYKVYSKTANQIVNNAKN